ncbi:Hypothetical protein A7982_07771 [Minicystis rosea]|nr:Hypothetical protein A7982_07771 [Minicystis rosea]
MGKRIHRRTLLRGLLGGMAVGLALPTLDIFLDNHGEALASGDSFPKRFGVWFWGNGVGPNPDNWVPTGTGADWKLSPIMAPLIDVKDEITVVSGLKVYTPNNQPHGTGPAGILTGGRAGPNGETMARTIDQVIADQIGTDTVNRSLEVSVDRVDTTPSYSEPGKPNPPESNPAVLFDALFGPTFHLPGDTVTVDPKLGLRRSILDAVGEDAKALKNKLGSNDRARLDQHMDNVRSLEQKIAKLEAAPPVLDACKKPMAPLPDYPDIDGRPQLSAVSRVISDILAMSLACDQQRVFTFQFSHSVNNLLFKDAPAGHHQLTHDELGDQPTVQNILQQILSEASYFIQALKNIKEGNATLLDHCGVLFMTDCSNGKSHAVDEYPLFIAGSANGALKKGIHHRVALGENASKLGLTLLHAYDVAATSYGSDEGFVTQGLPAIEAT